MNPNLQNSAPVTPKKNNLGWIIPIVALSLACIGMGGYIIASSISGANGGQVETDRIQAEQNDSADSTDTENANINSAQKPVIADVTKRLNDTDGNTYTQYYQFFAGITVKTNDKEFTFSYTPATLCDYYNLDCQQDVIFKTSSTIEFDQTIADVFYGGYGQNGPYNDTIFILLEDGTVEYMPLIHMFNAPATTEKALGEAAITVKSYGKLDGVSDVVKFSMAEVDDGFGGYGTTMAIKSDGSFYDLSTILEETGNY